MNNLPTDKVMKSFYEEIELLVQLLGSKTVNCQLVINFDEDRRKIYNTYEKLSDFVDRYKENPSYIVDYDGKLHFVLEI